MSMSAPSPPSPYTGMQLGGSVASAQNTINQDIGTGNQSGSMVNQNNPYGSLSYQQTGTGANGVPIYTSSVSLTPQQQQLFDTLQGTKGAAATGGQNLISNANYGSTSPTDAIGNMTSGITGDLMAKQNAYYQPFFNTERDQLDTKLKNQGLGPGTPAYDNAMRSMDTSHGLAETQAAAQFEPQAFNQASSLYQMPSTLGQSLAGFGAPGSPTSQLVQTPGLNVQPADLTSAVGTENKAQQDQYAAQQQQYSAMMSGLFGIPTAALGGWAKGGFPGMGSLMGGSSLGAGEAAGVTGAVDSSLAGMGDMAALLAV